MTYDLKANEETQKNYKLDEVMANFYGKSVQGLTLKQISSDVNSPKESDHDKTCSSIFSCNLFAKSSSESANSSNKNTTEKGEQLLPNDEKILLEQAPRTLAMICDVIGCDQMDELN